MNRIQVGSATSTSIGRSGCAGTAGAAGVPGTARMWTSRMQKRTMTMM